MDLGCLNWAAFEDVPLGAVFNSGENAGQPTGCPDLPLYDRLVERSPWQCGGATGDPQAVLVKPGAPGDSYLFQKVMGCSCDGLETMPPPNQSIAITPEQIELLRRWIAAGAPYDG